MANDIWSTHQRQIKSGVDAKYELIRRSMGIALEKERYRTILALVDSVSSALGTKTVRRYPKANERMDLHMLEERVGTAQENLVEVDSYLERQTRQALEYFEDAGEFDRKDSNHPVNLALTGVDALLHLRPVGKYLGVHTSTDVEAAKALHTQTNELARAYIKQR